MWKYRYKINLKKGLNKFLGRCIKSFRQYGFNGYLKVRYLKILIINNVINLYIKVWYIINFLILYFNLCCIKYF